MIEKHRYFVGCEKDFRCLETSMPSLVEAYSSQLLNRTSNLTGDEQLIEAARVYLKAVNGGRGRGALDCWMRHLYCRLSSSSRSPWCPTFAIFTKEKEGGEHVNQWDACTVAWGDGSGCREVDNVESNGGYGMLCQAEACFIL